MYIHNLLCIYIILGGNPGIRKLWMDYDHYELPEPLMKGQQYLRSQPVAVAVWARQAPPWGPVHQADFGEEESRKRCTAQAGSRDKTGSQDGLSLIPSKGRYISVRTKLYIV